MTVDAVQEVPTMDSAGVSRSSSQLSGSSESLNSNNNSSDDGNNNNNNSMNINGTVLKEISGNGNNLVFKVSAGPLAMGPKVMGAKKKMSAPPQMIEQQSKMARQQHNNNLPKLKIASIKEECGTDDECPPSAAISEADSDVEYMGNRTEILPWNIVEDAPLTNRNELYPVEGSWRLISQQNYDKYLAAIGVTPLMAQMVLRSDFMITIYEDIDHCWKILTETSIKAKSIKGYKCRNYKMTSNKFMLDEPKPELLDDWDPRLVVTTVTFDEETHSTITFDQAAEKDQKFKTSSRLVAVAEISPDGDISKDQITLTCETEKGVKAVRKLIRHIKPTQDGPFGFKTNRKVSAPF